MIRATTLGAGAFDQRITVQVDTATDTDRDANGAQLEIWDAAGTDFQAWAAFAVEPSRPGGAEYFGEEKRRVENKATFRVKYWTATAAIGPGSHRILHRGITWNIQRVFDPDGSRKEIHIEVNSIT
jgi:hypothetical protein